MERMPFNGPENQDDNSFGPVKRALGLLVLGTAIGVTGYILWHHPELTDNGLYLSFDSDCIYKNPNSGSSFFIHKTMLVIPNPFNADSMNLASPVQGTSYPITC